MKPPVNSVVWYFLRPYKFLYGVILLITLCTAILESLNLAAFFPVFNSLLDVSGQSSPGGILGILMPLVSLLPFKDPIVAASVVLIGIVGIKSIFKLLKYASYFIKHIHNQQFIPTKLHRKQHTAKQWFFRTSFCMPAMLPSFAVNR